MTLLEDKARKRAAELLESGEVTQVIAWGAGRFPRQTTPLFVSRAEKAQDIVINNYCINTLSKYAFAEKSAGKLAVFVRGCDSRGINRMIADKQLAREELYLLGVPCEGVQDRLTNELLSKCATCTHRSPVVYDELLSGEGAAETEPTPQASSTSAGAGLAEPAAIDRFAAVEALEALPREERLAYFNEAYSRCIRCYACREVCPVCTCRECFVDQNAAGWQGKKSTVEENRFYNLTRVFHIGDRCVECGECECVCPMDLPLMVLNRKWIKELDTLFAAGEEGLTAELDNALGCYDLGDVEEFM